MLVYLGRDRKHATATMTAVQDVLQGLEIWDINYTWTFFCSHLYNDLHVKAINCCGTVTQYRKGMPSDFGRRLRLKWGDIKD
jgi:hypothetical protein